MGKGFSIFITILVSVLVIISLGGWFVLNGFVFSYLTIETNEIKPLKEIDADIELVDWDIYIVTGNRKALVYDSQIEQGIYQYAYLKNLDQKQFYILKIPSIGEERGWDYLVFYISEKEVKVCKEKRENEQTQGLNAKYSPLKLGDKVYFINSTKYYWYVDLAVC